MLFTHRVGAVSWVDTDAIEQEAYCIRHLALAVAESIHELFELSGPLYLEEHFVVVIRDLDVEVLRGALLLWPCASR